MDTHLPEYELEGRGGPPRRNAERLGRSGESARLQFLACRSRSLAERPLCPHRLEA